MSDADLAAKLDRVTHLLVALLVLQIVHVVGGAVTGASGRVLLVFLVAGFVVVALGVALVVFGE